jgi:hypothetical protein
MLYAMLATFGVALAILGYVSLTSQHYRRLVPRLPSGELRLPPRHHLASLQHSGRYRGVAVTTHCRAAGRLHGHEFAFDQAPALPVTGCDAPVCRCRYLGLPERRHGTDRRCGIERRAGARIDSSDRRQAPDRRQRPRDPRSRT